MAVLQKSRHRGLADMGTVGELRNRQVGKRARVSQHRFAKPLASGDLQGAENYAKRTKVGANIPQSSNSRLWQSWRCWHSAPKSPLHRAVALQHRLPSFA